MANRKTLSHLLMAHLYFQLSTTYASPQLNYEDLKKINE